jgi:hypothetical protein
MTIDARVEMAPKELQETVLKALESVIGGRLRVTVHNVRAFRPACPGRSTGTQSPSEIPPHGPQRIPAPSRG